MEPVRDITKEAAGTDPDAGLRAVAGRDGAFLPLGPGAGQAFLAARREAQARHAAQPASVEDLALGILAVTEGLVPPILSRLGVPEQVLSAAILDRRRAAG